MAKNSAATIDQTISVCSGASYTIKAFAKGNTICTLQICAGTTCGSAITLGTYPANAYSFTFTAAASSVDVKLVTLCSGSGSAGTVDIDDVSIA